MKIIGIWHNYVNANSFFINAHCASPGLKNKL